MSLIGKNELEKGFEKEDNEEEIRKYGIQQKKNTKKSKIIFIIIVIFAFLFFFISVYLLHSVNELKRKLKSAYIISSKNKNKLLNQLNEEKEKNEFLNNENKRMKKYIDEIENEYSFIKREKGNNIDVNNNDMNDDMIQYAIKIAKEAYYYNKNDDGIAQYIKKEFDSKYNKYWECIVGLSYSFAISHNRKEYIYFKLGEYDVILFRVTD